jgi:two-component system cell cycle sensor histidine kinase/response regulator CckA
MKTLATSVLQSLKRYTARPEPAADEPLTVLVVDDEESIRLYVDRVLSDAGYRTTLAVDGADAIAAAARVGRFDLLLTDVTMPEMTGAELARRLRKNDPQLKVLYLTGFSDRLFKEKVSLWNEEAFLEKPCSVAGLLEAVSLAITGRTGTPGAVRRAETA